jgi:hypothetical protein
MLEPTLSLIVSPQKDSSQRLPAGCAGALRLKRWVAAAPFACAALWAAGTGAALLVGMATGWQAPLDWLRSGHGLIAATALTAAAVLLAALIESVPRRVERRARRRPSSPREPGAVSGWLLEEGRFKSA